MIISHRFMCSILVSPISSEVSDSLSIHFSIFWPKIAHSSIALTITGLEGHICPSLVKGLEGHICLSVVTPWWRHCDVI